MTADAESITASSPLTGEALFDVPASRPADVVSARQRVSAELSWKEAPGVSFGRAHASHGHRRGTGLSQADRLMLLSRLPSAVAAAQQEPSPPTTRLVNLHRLPLRELSDRSAFRGQVAGVHTGRYTEPTRLPIHEVDLG